MQIDIKKIKKRAKENFEKTWIETSALLDKKKNNFNVIIKKHGKEHILGKTINHLRNIFLQMGFDETENLTIIPQEDIYREYGPESVVILDRTFYIAKLPRPEIGLSDEIIDKIKNIANVDIDILKDILRKYKKGYIEGDDFVEELVKKLGIQTHHATAIIDLFVQLKNLKPIPTNLTFRSHMSGTWYHTLAAIQDKFDFPVMLFSVGRRYRNEQKEDFGHLRIHNSASIVIMDSNINIIAGRRIVKKIFEKIGFKKVKFKTKKATSKYYALGLEDEVFVKHNGQWLEIADMGMYSAISLSNYNIRYPVFNIGFGVERLAMVLEGYKDIRKMIYPQFYLEDKLSDRKIAEDLKYIEFPKTTTGKKIAKAIIKTASEHKDDIAPVKISAWKGSINNEKIEVFLTEIEEGKKLIGPAAFNIIFVNNGNIIAFLDNDEGEKTGISFISAIANNAAGKIEQGIKKETEIYTGIIRSLANINLKISAKTKKYIEANNKKIDVKGPVFVTIKIVRG